MKEITMEQMKNLEENQEFMDKLNAVKSVQDKLKIFAEYGIEISEEEFEKARNQAYNILEEQGYIEDGELTERSLDMVSGGVNTWICGAGVTIGSVGLLLMMAGGGPAVWAVGCAIGLIGIVTR